MAERRVGTGGRLRHDRRVLIGYAVAAVAIFVIFLIGRFPYAEALSAVLAPSGLKLNYQAQRFSLPFGVELDDVRLSPAGAALGPPIVQSRQMTLAPTLSALLLGRVAVRVRAELYDGLVHATLTRVGDLLDVDFDLHDLELARWQGPDLMRLPVDGLLSGQGDVMLDRRDFLADSGHVEFSGKRLTMRFTSMMPPVRFDNLNGTLSIDRGLVKIEKLDGHGADMALTAQGAIHLARDLRESTVDLTFALEPTEQGRSRLALLLAILPHPPGPQPYTLRGPIRFPLIS
ncbi:MAG: type II secretion system protein GspN [Candidatus Binataceae bacterium]